VGIVPTHEALGMAREAGLDLVEDSPMETPPVCRIMDYGKFKYDSKKRQKQTTASHQAGLKEVRLRPKTDPHDIELKLRKVVKFIDEGHKVQFTMLFRGRERFFRDLAEGLFAKLVEQLGDKIRVERTPSMEGRRMTMLVSPAKAAVRPPTKPSTSGNAHPAPRPPRSPEGGGSASPPRDAETESLVPRDADRNLTRPSAPVPHPAHAPAESAQGTAPSTGQPDA
jgi:translation initiation factor IF-3